MKTLINVVLIACVVLLTGCTSSYTPQNYYDAPPPSTNRGPTFHVVEPEPEVVQAPLPANGVIGVHYQDGITSYFTDNYQTERCPSNYEVLMILDSGENAIFCWMHNDNLKRAFIFAPDGKVWQYPYSQLEMTDYFNQKYNK